MRRMQQKQQRRPARKGGFGKCMIICSSIRPEDSALVEAAAAIGCDVERFVREVAEHRYAPRVCEDFFSGIHSGVNGTPSLFINGMRYDGARDLDSLLGGDRITGGLESALRRATSAVRVAESEQ